MIVDSHLHLFRDGYTGFGCASPLGGTSDIDAYENLRIQYGIAAGLVICYTAGGIDPGNNAYVRGLAQTRSWIHSVAYVDPRSQPAVDAIETLLSAGHIGIALYLPDADLALDVVNWPVETWAALDEVHAIVSLNAPPGAIAELFPLIERASNCSFLFSHLGLPGRHESIPSESEAVACLAPLLRLARLPNVGVKISGVYAVDPVSPHESTLPFLDVLLERFATAHLHWGSDFSPALEFVQFEGTINLAFMERLNIDDRALIMGEGLANKVNKALHRERRN